MVAKSECYIPYHRPYSSHCSATIFKPTATEVDRINVRRMCRSATKLHPCRQLPPPPSTPPPPLPLLPKHVNQYHTAMSYQPCSCTVQKLASARSILNVCNKLHCILFHARVGRFSTFCIRGVWPPLYLWSVAMALTSFGFTSCSWAKF